MTQEERNLLLRDLSARLPYEVLCKINREGFEDYEPQILKAVYDSGTCYFDYGIAGKAGAIENNEIIPYLRPMSSMTNDERFKYLDFLKVEIQDGGYVTENYVVRLEYIPELIDWLNAHHFDYRGLIEKGLALEAPKNMYKIK